jgi:Flp pilus assembly protein TadD
MVDEGRFADALAALQAAAWFDETSPLPHHYLANVYYLIGRLEDATRQQREALQRAPDNQLYRRNLTALETAVRPPNTPSSSKSTNTLR